MPDLTELLQPSMAELARTVIACSPAGVLATVDLDGRPAVGTVPIVDDGAGSPVTVMSNLSTHTMRGRQDQRAGMAIGDRLLVQGDLRPVPGLQQIELQEQFLARHPQLAVQVESLDYSWLRLESTRVRWTDGDGDERWIRPEDVAGAQPDPLGEHVEQLLPELIDRLDDDILLLARGLAGRWLASAAELVHLDRYGLVLSVTEPGRTSQSRVPFPVRLETIGDVHAAVAALAAAARSTPAARADGIDQEFVPRTTRADGPDSGELLDRIAAEQTVSFSEPSANESADDASVTDEDVLDSATVVDESLLWPPSRLERAPSLLDRVEGDGGGGTDVDGIDGAGHRNSYSLFDSLERAGREARSLGTEEQGDGLADLENEIGDVDGVGGRGESDAPEAATLEDVETSGELIESGVGESEGLAHADPG
ncbi:MAG: hypothetical protein ACI8TP_001149 [Acidimicrobiales bacterium]|jgi:hypothetical protein